MVMHFYCEYTCKKINIWNPIRTYVHRYGTYTQSLRSALLAPPRVAERASCNTSYSMMKLKAGQLMGGRWRGTKKDGGGWCCFGRCRKFHISKKMLKIYAAAFAVMVSA